MWELIGFWKPCPGGRISNVAGGKRPLEILWTWNILISHTAPRVRQACLSVCASERLGVLPTCVMDVTVSFSIYWNFQSIYLKKNPHTHTQFSYFFHPQPPPPAAAALFSGHMKLFSVCLFLLQFPHVWEIACYLSLSDLCHLTECPWGPPMLS